jgi:hypothetical protein
MLKYRWKVQPKPTGRFASFERRGWPEVLVGDVMIAYIRCEDDYIPHLVRLGLHKPLKLMIRCRRELTKNNNCPWTFYKFKTEFATLPEAKKALSDFIEKYPDHDFVIGT